MISRAAIVVLLTTLIPETLFAADLAPSTTTLVTSPNPAVMGRAVALTAAVTPANADGRVTFYDGSAIVGTAPLSAGQASITTTLLPFGPRQLKAYYQGGIKYAPSMSLVSTMVVAANPESKFSTPLVYPLDTKPGASVVADFNGDGKADIAVVTGDTVSIFQGMGDGFFQLVSRNAAGAGANFLAAGDFNGDGNTDLAIPTTAGVMILLGEGDGTFQPPVNSAAGVAPGPIVVADFNGDGIADFATGFSSLTVVLGNGDGTFPQPHMTSLPVTVAQVQKIETADCNGDGKTDLLALYSGLLYLFLGNGDGSFQPPQVVATEATSFAVGDFNGDGVQDVVMAFIIQNPPPARVFVNRISLLLGQGDGTFKDANIPFFPTDFLLHFTDPTLMLVADFNGDGKADLAFRSNGGLKISFGDGTGNFAPPSFNTNLTPASIAVGEFNGDGITDLALLTDSSLQVVLGDHVAVTLGLASSLNPSVYGGPSPAFTVTASPPSTTGNVSLHFGAPSFFDFPPKSPVPLVDGQALLNFDTTTPGAYSLYATYDEDGSVFGVQSPTLVQTINKTPTALTVNSSQNPLALGQSVRLTLRVSLPIDGYVQIFEGADEVGFADIVSGNATTLIYPRNIGVHSYVASFHATASEYYIDATVVFTQTINSPTPARISLTSSPNPVTYGHNVTLNASVPSDASGAVTFYDGVSTLGIRAVTNGQATLKTKLLPFGPHSLKAYYSGDAKYSPVSSRALSQTVYTLPANGFQSPVDYTTKRPVNSIVIADFNGDGTPDLAVAQDDASVTVLLGNGDGSFQSPVNYMPSGYSTAGSTSYLAAGDFNGDGVTDLAIGRVKDALVSVLLGNGDGTFGPFKNTLGDQYSLSPSFAVSIAVADFNGDGRDDIALAADDHSFGRIFGEAVILRGTGNGTFETFPYSDGPSLRSIAVGDFDGDGYLDLVNANVNNGSVGIQWTYGYGQTRLPSITPVGQGPVSVAVGDFNGDRKPDLAVANYTDNNISILLGVGDGTFRQAVNYEVGVNPNGIAVGDFNGDGHADLIVSSTTGLSLLLGRGDGTFAPATNFGANANVVAVADFNGDGVPDIVAATNNGLSIFLGLATPR